jgi:hypothetical protein
MRNESVKFLESWLNHNGLLALADYGIRVTTDDRYPDLYCLKYGPTADKSSDIVRVCRGAVVELNECDGHRVVAYAFDRFFNAGEFQAAEIDWESARVFEKHDGSLIKLFHHEQFGWIVSTSGTVGANIRFGEMDATFEQLFWRAFEANYGDPREKLDPKVVYVFELCTPDNKVVVDHKFDYLPLLAARDARTMEEIYVESFSGLFAIATEYGRWSDIGKLIEWANERKGAEHEGFVVVDKHWNRIKVKGESYVQMHRTKGNGDPSFFELWKNDDLVEFWTYFPEFKERFQKKLSSIEDAAFMVEGFVREYSTMNQKEFAAQVLYYHPKVSGAMFSIRAGKVDGFVDWMMQQTEKKFEEIFGESV